MELEPLITTLLLLLLAITGINAIVGVVAIGMAKKRGMLPIPAFFAGLFGSVVALLILAAIPVKPQADGEGKK